MAAPERSCRVCRQRAGKSALKRWVVQVGQLVADPTQKLSGRGYYSDSDRCAALLPQVIKRKKVSQ